MSKQVTAARILLISQWPNVKNGEYELIEKIKQTDYKIVVIDYFGFDVDSGECLNKANLRVDFDFAISFHYDTPKFINLPTYLWVANPLEFMHLRDDYKTVILPHLRSYDDYLYNGSDTLKGHIRNVVGNEWRDSTLEMFPACSLRTMIPPKSLDKLEAESTHKVFYCGVNWERGTDQVGRAQDILDILQDKDAADFYGPDKLEGISPWEGFKSYKGEIPFDGVTMAQVMHKYGAVLAVSSPAHIKSRTSSSRVFEGLSAGVPVISDENYHVKKLFGDLVYYFKGDTEEHRAQSILEALRHINENPVEARDRVVRAQAIMAERYCFEPCFEKIISHVKKQCLTDAIASVDSIRHVDVFLVHHDPDPSSPGSGKKFHNAKHVIDAAIYTAEKLEIDVRITCCGGSPVELDDLLLPPNVTWEHCDIQKLTAQNWDGLRLGEKVAMLGDKLTGDFTTFLTQFDFPNYDSFSKPIQWFDNEPKNRANAIYVGGFFVNDLTAKAPKGTLNILRNNASTSMYRWTQSSLAEHLLGTLFFARGSLELLAKEQVDRFDVLLPVSILASAAGRGYPIKRSRYILLRTQFGYFGPHYEAYGKAVEKGFWAQHYDLVTNYNHELNALYDIHHESAIACEIVNQVSGHALPLLLPIDPAVHMVNQFISRLRPIYRKLRTIKHSIMFWTH